jgi:hypothetical protein
LVLGFLSLLSLADLRTRALPGIKIFFFAATLFGLIDTPGKVFAVWMGVGWGMEFAFANLLPRFPIGLIIPAIFYPAAWPVLLAAAGVRKQLVAPGDLLALGAVACLLPWYGALCAFMGVYFWRIFWQKECSEPVPALLGMFLGAMVALGWGLFR